MVINSVFLQLAGFLLFKHKNITASLGNRATSITLPQSHFSTSLSPLALLFEAPAQASGCLAAGHGGLVTEAGAALSRSGKHTSTGWRALLLPSACSWLMGKRMENWKQEFLVLKWNFTPSLRWYFRGWFFFSSYNSSWRF